MFKRKLKGFFAMLMSILLVAGMVTNVTAQTLNPGDSSYAYAGQLDLRLLESYLSLSDDSQFDIADLKGSEQSWREDVPAPQQGTDSQIDIEALELINLNLGQLPIPLVGEDALLEFALGESQVGALAEYANAKTATQALAGVGLVADQGGLELTQPGAGMNAKINLLSLLQLNNTELLGNVIDEAAVELGALSAYAEKPDAYLGEICDTDLDAVPVDYVSLEAGALPGYAILDPDIAVTREDDGKFCSSYQIADAKVRVHAPVLGDLVSGLEPIFEDLDATVNGLVASGGVVDSLLSLLEPVLGLLGLGLEINVEVPAKELYENLLDAPLADDKGLLTISLRTGEIIIDLEKIDGRNPTTGLNGLPANTPLLTADNIAEILDTLTSLLTAPATGSNGNPNGLIATLEGVLKGTEINGVKRGGIYASEVHLNLSLSLITGIELTSTLGALLDSSTTEVNSDSEWKNHKDSTYYIETRGLVGGITKSLAIPLLKGVGGTLDLLLFSEVGLLSILTAPIGGVVGGVLNSLNPVLNTVLMPLANIIVNRQNVEHYPEGNLFHVSALEVNVLKVLPGEAALRLPVAAAAVMAQSFDPASLELGKFVQNADGLEGVTPPADSFELSYQCVYPTEEDETRDRFTLAYSHDRSVLAPLSGTRTVTAGLANNQIVDRLPTGAECEIAEVAPTSSDPLHKWTHLGWITDRFSDGKVIEHDSPSHTVLLEPGLNGDAMFVGAVNAYESALIDLNLKVAAIGNGHGFATDGFSYRVMCTAPGWTGIEQMVTYGNNSVGDSFSYNPLKNELSLRNSLEPTPIVTPGIQVIPGADCSIATTGSAVEPKAALKPTGDTASRTPYTYFLDVSDTEVRVSGDTLAGQDTDMSSAGVSIDATSGLVKVTPPAGEVGDEWKTQTFHFTVPEADALDPSGYNINIVHTYDIDTREIKVRKEVSDADKQKENFDFQVYLNGETLDGFSLRHDEAFSVEVPVMDSNLKPSRFTITESLGDDVSGPVVSWDLKEGTEDQLFTPEAPGKIFFEAGPVTDANSTSTTPWNLTVTNEYAQIAFDKTIDGALPGDLASTTILSPTADEMTIRYTVKNLGVDGETAIQIQDKSLLDYEFVLPEGIGVSEDGTITGCTFEFVDGEATCEITVGIPGGTDQDFRYEAAQAEATATLTVEVGDRTVIASATDGHGALRLSKLAGMLPATGVTTLVWTLGLGLLIAVGSVVYFVRSRRD